MKSILRLILLKATDMVKIGRNAYEHPGIDISQQWRQVSAKPAHSGCIRLRDSVHSVLASESFLRLAQMHGLRSASSSVMNYRQRIMLERALEARRAVEREFGYDVFDNFGWRELSVIQVLNSQLGFSLVHLGGRRGPDATCQQWKSVSIKTSTVNGCVVRLTSGRVEFQRQTQERYRNTALFGYDAIAFALFCKNTLEPLLVVFVHDAQALYAIRGLLIERQKRFVEQPNPTRDSIQLSFRDIYQILDGTPYELIAFGKRITDKQTFFACMKNGSTKTH